MGIGMRWVLECDGCWNVMGIGIRGLGKSIF